MNSPKKNLVTNLGDEYEMSQKDVAEKLFLSPNTIAVAEKQAIAKFKKLLAERNIDLNDLI